MMSAESESAQIISTLQEMKFALDEACSAVDKAAATVKMQIEN
jgi:hypothetical protein